MLRVSLLGEQAITNDGTGGTHSGPVLVAGVPVTGCA